MANIRYIPRLTRGLIQAEPEARFVFGDNVARTGLGGQAREARGEPNAIGIATKWRPTMNPADFFRDGDERAIAIIKAGVARVWTAAREGRRIYVPADGIGTGLADLPRRAPRLYARLRASFEKLGGAPCPWP